MSSFQIIVGSMLGGTEYVAEACQETLSSLNHQTQLHFSPEFEQIPIKDQIWLICTSTHGAGDYPDNLLPFVNKLRSNTQDLSPIKFFVIGVGDSSYDTFCQAAKNITTELKSKGCKELISLKTLDMQLDLDPEDEAQAWILANKDRL
ncbi:FMN-binding protein MioC [Thalassotalea insulae]|uniref:FMN-binding protein MioC n=1 Tax=Thalassotalea insulae TaxID=2056778 RepID=A0ABQ6GRE5_9GAMM|nr:FMN-binding protein MioC [Thalassotalea insulae]GLX78492.1 FMN-binding protein MioC [Thalassotalea insulae]